MSISMTEIGGTPTDEDCAALGVTDNFDHYNRLECTAYIEALTRVYGFPPDGSQFTIKANRHDFGVYREVAYRFNGETAAHHDYADKVEPGLATWREAGLWAPVQYQRSQMIHLIEGIERLDIGENPHALDAKGVARVRETAAV